MKRVSETKATTIITTTGCLLQMKLGIERQNNSGIMRALHLVEYLAKALGIT